MADSTSRSSYSEGPGIRIPSWLTQILSAVAVGSLLPGVLWFLNLEYRTRDLEKEIARQGSDMHEMKRLATQMEILQNDLRYIREGQEQLRQLMLSEHGREDQGNKGRIRQ